MSDQIKLDENADFSDELNFQTERSSKPGGQHANKTETRVMLRFDLETSVHLNDLQKKYIREKLAGYLNKDGVLIISSEETRSQAKNKTICLEKFYKLLHTALQKPKKRKPTKPTQASRKKRLEEKRQQSEKKSRRQKPDL